MRLTKRLLRDTKRSLLRRIRELGMMDDTAILKEFKRVFPNRPPELTPAFVNAQRTELLQDTIELSLPDHWMD